MTTFGFQVPNFTFGDGDDQMFANVVRGIPGAQLQSELAGIRARRGVAHDCHLNVDELRELVERFKALIETRSQLGHIRRRHCESAGVRMAAVSCEKISAGFDRFEKVEGANGPAGTEGLISFA